MDSGGRKRKRVSAGAEDEEDGALGADDAGAAAAASGPVLPPPEDGILRLADDSTLACVAVGGEVLLIEGEATLLVLRGRVRVFASVRDVSHPPLLISSPLCASAVVVEAAAGAGPDCRAVPDEAIETVIAFCTRRQLASADQVGKQGKPMRW